MPEIDFKSLRMSILSDNGKHSLLLSVDSSFVSFEVICVAPVHIGLRF